MKKKYTNILILAMLMLVFIYAATNVLQKEGFGATSPGTLVQLMSSHVPTQSDLDYYKNVYPKQVRGEIARMTGGDTGNVALYPF
jgi:hypothetical protein